MYPPNSKQKSLTQSSRLYRVWGRSLKPNQHAKINNLHLLSEIGKASNNKKIKWVNSELYKNNYQDFFLD